MPELLVIFLVALIIFGPRRLPELGRALGQTLQEFRRASSNLQHSLEDEIAAEKSSSATKPVPVAAPPGTESR